MRPTVTDRV